MGSHQATLEEDVTLFNGQTFSSLTGRTSGLPQCQLEQIQFLLGHVSVQTTQHYLGCRQRLKNAVNDCIGIEPEDLRPCG